MSKELDTCLEFSKAQIAELESLREQNLAQAAQIETLNVIIGRIQHRCAGEAMPNWENTPRTGHSRGLVLDWTNYALQLCDPSQALEQFAAKVRSEAFEAVIENLNPKHFITGAMYQSTIAAIRKMAKEMQ